jgi:hypothetical protein
VIWIDLALDVPKELLWLVVRERRVEHVELVGVREEFKINRGGIDECVGPGELEWIDPFLERDRARLAHQCEVFAVVDRKLDAIPLRYGRKVDIAGKGQLCCNERSGGDTKKQTTHGPHATHLDVIAAKQKRADRRFAINAT